jgi:MarR family transcriptional regulator, organic hydroperoxide resistance regulator
MIAVMSIPVGGNDDLVLERQLVLALSVASQTVINACAPVLQELNLTHPQYLVMLALWDKSPRSGRELGGVLPESESLAPVLLRLEESGYIQTLRVQGDMHPSEVGLSPKGTALYKRALGISGTILGRLGLSPDEADELCGAMPRLLKDGRPDSTSSGGA